MGERIAIAQSVDLDKAGFRRLWYAPNGDILLISGGRSKRISEDEARELLESKSPDLPPAEAE